MTDLRLSQIYIYPVKSLRGIAVNETELTDRGPQWDRRWMLVDPEGTFLSQRELSEMALLQPQLDGDQLRIADLRGGREDLKFPLEVPAGASGITVSIWQDHCEALLVGEAADAWFSEALGTPCRLVFMPDTSRRPVDPKYAKGEEVVSFADGYPYLILGEQSMLDLNNRLPEPIEIIRFRPNLVFSGGAPFAEDNWRQLLIGAAQFRGTKPCARCQIPTIDLHTGQSSKEPTRTLATFRRDGNKVLSGLNACWEPEMSGGHTVIKIGDPVRILS